MSTMQEFFAEHLDVIALLTPVFVFLLGVWLGVSKRIVVYRNFSDLSLVFLLVIVPALAMSVFVSFNVEDISFAIKPFLVFESVMLLLISFLTLRDNGWNPFKAILALYVKLPLGVFFIFYFMEALSSKKRERRRYAFLITALLMPVIIALVRDKEGAFAPAATIKRGLRSAARR